ncbi:MAG: hypothetical protein HY735_05930 [Verrucomicrobia bacterium]|nr:hypothetical protein [Verrucomicrobiota bacterium]
MESEVSYSVGGTSNLSLTGKIAHFELGYIPESARELKAAADSASRLFG